MIWSNNSWLYVLACASVHGFETKTPNPRILVVGGNGRVGGSTSKWIHLLSESEGRPVDVIIGGRSQTNFMKSQTRIVRQLTETGTTPPAFSFHHIDLDSGVEGLSATFEEIGRLDCVVHTAGPFQQRTQPDLLRVCVELGVPYVDVCDEVILCKAAKELQAKAQASGCVAVVAGGIWPGASALMAAEAVAKLRQMEQASLRKASGGEPGTVDNVGEGKPCEGEDVTMSFFTAGTGNAGATIVSATFLLLCSPVLTFLEGVLVEKEPWSEPLSVDFGEGVGERCVRLLDNPDVYTVQEALRVPNICSRFATAPGIWNQLFGAMKEAVPAAVLSNRELMQKLSVFSLPIIRAVDLLVGATNAMRVDASGGQFGHRVRFQVTHQDLEQCVGLATAAFALQLLAASPTTTTSSSSSSPPSSSSADDPKVPPGIYFPAELPAPSRSAILDRVKLDATLWEFEAVDGTRAPQSMPTY